MAETPVPAEPRSEMSLDSGIQENSQLALQGNSQLGLEGDSQYGIQGNPGQGAMNMNQHRNRRLILLTIIGIKCAVLIVLGIIIVGIVWDIRSRQHNNARRLIHASKDHVKCDDGRECSYGCRVINNSTSVNRNQEEADNWGSSCKSGHCRLDSKNRLVCANRHSAATSLTYSFRNVIMVFLGVIQLIQIQIA